MYFFEVSENVDTENLEQIVILISNMVTKSPKITEFCWSLFSPLIFTLTGSEEEIKLFKIINPSSKEFYIGIGLEHIDKICVILMNFLIRDSIYFLNGNDNYGEKFINRTMSLVDLLVKISSTKKTEFEGCNAIKIIIVMLESLKGKLDFLFESILMFIIEQLKVSRTEYYKTVLINSVQIN